MKRIVGSKSVIHSTGIQAFVLNLIEIEAELPFELIPGCYIDRASKDLRDRIKESLVKYGLPFIPTSSPVELRYEHQLVADPNPNDRRGTFERLPESDWRYYVITIPDDITHNYLNHVSNITDIPLELSGLAFPAMGGMNFNAGILQNSFRVPDHLDPVPKVSHEFLNELSYTYGLYMEILNGISDKTGFPEIQRAMEMFHALGYLNRFSDFHVLGLFAIIEMLITHNPKLEDRGDSITHQMQSKLPLLSHRFSRSLDYSCFCKAPEKKIWEALYKYRSALAHGGVADFQSAELKLLKDNRNAKSFLKEVVKALLRHSLKEPQLYKDLRNC